MLVAAKCDNLPASRQVQPRDIADKARTIIADMQVFESALNTKDAPLAGVQALLMVMISQGTWPAVPSLQYKAISRKSNFVLELD